MALERRRTDSTPQVQSPAPLQTSSPTHIKVKFFNTRNLAIIVMGAVFIVAMMRADPKDIPEIVNSICSSHDVAIIGWIFAVFILLMSIALIRIICKINEREIERLVKERDLLQKTLLEGGGKS